MLFVGTVIHCDVISVDAANAAAICEYAVQVLYMIFPLQMPGSWGSKPESWLEWT